jgi:hypothetical protein
LWLIVSHNRAPFTGKIHPSCDIRVEADEARLKEG